jgi:hypothetical protein
MFRHGGDLGGESFKHEGLGVFRMMICVWGREYPGGMVGGGRIGTIEGK